MRTSRFRPLVPLAFAAALIALLALAPAAFGDALTPESGGSQQAEDIDTLYKLALYMGLVVFLVVEGTLIWSLVRYRLRRGGPTAAQVRGNTPLELGWTVAAAALVLVLTAVTFIYLDDIENPPPSGPGGLADRSEFASIDQPKPSRDGGPTLNIDVNGQQYLWRYDYGGKDALFTYYEMVVPTKTTVVLNVTASDVIHSWWIPKLGGKVDGVPGHDNETWFKIDKPGIYKGACAELCGFNHADMRAQVRAVPPAAFQDWADRQRADIKAAQTGLAQQRQEREGTRRKIE